MKINKQVGSLIVLSTLAISSMWVSFEVQAEESTYETSETVEVTEVSTEETQQSEIETLHENTTENTRLSESIEKQPETTESTNTAEDINPQRAKVIINGEEVLLEDPIKAGSEEAQTTVIPKEELYEGVSRFRSIAPREATISMYRMYNPNSGEHFYTQNTYERDHLRRVGWNYEGIGWKAPTKGMPVYRLFNRNSGEHFYTLNSYERDHLVKLGWRYEGIGWYSHTGANSLPVYRLYNPNSGWHHYTLNSYERNYLVSLGWKSEGTGWNAVGLGEGSNEDYHLLNVNNYDQYALGAPSGCEGASLLQAFQYKGLLNDWTLRRFLDTIPKSPNNNPNTGFVGSPYVENYWTYSAIYPEPLTQWGNRFGRVVNISGSSFETLLSEVQNNNPVVVWVTINFQPVRWGNWPFGPAVNNNHAVTLDGYNRGSNQVHVSDPIGGKYWINANTFKSVYNVRKYAVTVQ